MKHDTDSFELSYMRSMTEGLSKILDIAVENRDWPLVEMVASEIAQVSKDAQAKAEQRYAAVAA